VRILPRATSNRNGQQAKRGKRVPDSRAVADVNPPPGQGALLSKCRVERFTKLLSPCRVTRREFQEIRFVSKPIRDSA